MPEDVKTLIQKSGAWKQLSAAINDRRSAQSVSVVLPAELQEEFVRLYAEIILAVDNPLDSPDCIFAGKYMTPPGIEEARALKADISLAPTVASKKLAVIWEANKLSLETMNSLLKITEEPPIHAAILFVASEDNLIPTIKSRVWNLHISLPEEYQEAKNYPLTDSDWCKWLDSNKKKSSDTVFMEVLPWVNFLVEQRDFEKAQNLERIIRLMEQKKLPVTMINDVIYALLKEELSYEQIFGDIW